MPKLSQTESTTSRVEFVASPSLDLINAMFFTSLVEQAEGIDEWPSQVRKEMAPDLLAELDFLFSFPKANVGVMGALTDLLFTHRETWTEIDALVRFVRGLPDGVEKSTRGTGIQGLILDALFCPAELGPQDVDPRSRPRESVAEALEAAGADVDAGLALYDQPAVLRERMAALIERFYDEHYRQELPRRLPCLQRSAAAHRGEPAGDLAALARKLSRRTTSCLDDPGDGNPATCCGPYTEVIFVPSLDMGPYVVCVDSPPVHVLYYPCEPEFVGTVSAEADEIRRLARLHKALGDEQRLRILKMLGEHEMYAQEIVDRMELHQSVVSRHLAFMTAVGLLQARRQNNMKFYSLNPATRDQLGGTLGLFAPALVAQGREP